MDLASSQAFFWLCFGIAVFAVAAFFCWVLYETARLIRQSNEIVEHARNMIAGIEQDFIDLKEKLGSVIGTLAGMVNSIKSITSFLHEEKKAVEHRPKKRFNKLLNEEENVEA